MTIRFRIFLGLICLATSASAQIGVRVFNYRPTGEFGFVMKPTMSLEIGLVNAFEDDERWRVNFTATFLIMKPRMETFPVYGTMTGQGTTVLPGEQSFNKYNIFQLYGGADFAIIKQDPFVIFIGGDLVAGAASVDYTHNIQTYKSESYSGGGILAGLRFRAGAEYVINDSFGLSFTANRSVFLVTEPAGIFAANDYGIGVRYSWNN